MLAVVKTHALANIITWDRFRRVWASGTAPTPAASTRPGSRMVIPISSSTSSCFLAESEARNENCENYGENYGENCLWYCWGVFFGQVTWFHMCCFYVFTLSKKISPATLQKFFLGLEDVRRAFWSKYEARFCCWDTFFEIRIIRTGSHWRRWHRASRSMTG